MSNHTRTTTTVPLWLAVTVVISLIAMTVVSVWLSIALFSKGDETGDLLYTIGGVLSLLCAWPSAGALIEILVDLIEAMQSE